MKRKRKPLGYQEPAGVPARVFVQVWQGANSLAEVAKQLNRTTNAVRVRAHKFRQRGVALKTFPPVEMVDWGEMAKFAESLGEGEVQRLPSKSCAKQPSP